jgi:site-specific DNA-methyltransferase (adenine-specific)
MIKLYKGDCLEIMKEIPDKSIDLILCDLPYGTTACKWDVVIPFDNLWEQYNRIIKDNGAIALFCCQPFTSVLVNSNLKGYKHHWIWLKNRGTGFQVAKYRPMMKTEDIIVFTKKGEKINYYPQMIKLDKPYFSRNASSTNGTNPLAHFNKGGKLVDSKYPTNVLEFSKVAQPIHPTQKPVALLEYLIKTYTNENETVLDNCMGSGSTGVACKHTNRNFIGIELDDNYFEIAKKRIEEE